MSDWIKRRYIPVEDGTALVYLWAKSYARSAYGRVRRAREGPDAEPGYWAEQVPVIEGLLACATTDVVCDPTRPVTTSEGPAVLWGFACTDGDIVHYVCVKRSVARAGLCGGIVRDLLGSRLSRQCGYTHELVEMRTRSCGVGLPSFWYSDPTFIVRRMIGARQDELGESSSVRVAKAVA